MPLFFDDDPFLILYISSIFNLFLHRVFFLSLQIWIKSPYTHTHTKSFTFPITSLRHYLVYFSYFHISSRGDFKVIVFIFSLVIHNAVYNQSLNIIACLQLHLERLQTTFWFPYPIICQYSCSLTFLQYSELWTPPYFHKFLLWLLKNYYPVFSLILLYSLLASPISPVYSLYVTGL